MEFRRVLFRSVGARVYHMTSLLHDYEAKIGSGVAGDEYDHFEKLWDDNQEAFLVERRNVFVGNIFLAMEVSIKNKLGAIGTFYDPKTSTRERAIIMRKNLANEDLQNGSTHG